MRAAGGVLARSRRADAVAGDSGGSRGMPGAAELVARLEGVADAGEFAAELCAALGETGAAARNTFALLARTKARSELLNIVGSVVDTGHARPSWAIAQRGRALADRPTPAGVNGLPPSGPGPKAVESEWLRKGAAPREDAPECWRELDGHTVARQWALVQAWGWRTVPMGDRRRKFADRLRVELERRAGGNPIEPAAPGAKPAAEVLAAGHDWDQYGPDHALRRMWERVLKREREATREGGES